MGRYRGVFGLYGVASLPFFREAPKKKRCRSRTECDHRRRGEKNQASHASAVVKEQLFRRLT